MEGLDKPVFSPPDCHLGTVFKYLSLYGMRLPMAMKRCTKFCVGYSYFFHRRSSIIYIRIIYCRGSCWLDEENQNSYRTLASSEVNLEEDFKGDEKELEKRVFAVSPKLEIKKKNLICVFAWMPVWLVVNLRKLGLRIQKTPPKTG